MSLTNAKHPNLGFILDRYDEFTTLNQFWIDALVHNFAKSSGKVDERRTMDLRFVHVLPTDSPVSYQLHWCFHPTQTTMKLRPGPKRKYEDVNIDDELSGNELTFDDGGSETGM